MLNYHPFRKEDFDKLIQRAGDLVATHEDLLGQLERELYRSDLVLRSKMDVLRLLRQRIEEEQFFRSILDRVGFVPRALPLTFSYEAFPEDLQDRDGALFPLERYTQIDTRTNALTLPLFGEESALLTEGRNMARIVRAFVSVESQTTAIGAEDPTELSDPRTSRVRNGKPQP